MPIDARSALGPAERLIALLTAFAEAELPPLDAAEPRYPKTLRLKAFPGALLDAALSDASAHTLIAMSHIDRAGRPFQSVLGFHYMDGKIHVMSRSNAAKIKRLQDNPACSFLYHTNVSGPANMGCLTLVGKARVVDDKAYIHRANVAMSHKAFRDSQIAPGGVETMIETMDNADRRAIVLDEIEGVYILTPSPPHLPAGLPLPVISWRADRSD